MKKWLQLAAVAGILALGVGVAACGDDNDNGGGGGASTNGGSTSDSSVANVEFTSPEQSVPTCYKEPQPKNYTIGFSNPLNANESVNSIARTVKLETEKLGGKTIDLDAKLEPDLQVSQIEQMIARKVNAIIIFPLDPKALDPVLKKAKAAGIPTIGIEANLQSTDPGLYTSQIWQRRDEMSYLQAQEAAKLLGKGGEYTQAGLAVPVPTIEAQVARAKFWGDKFGIKSLGRIDNPSDDIAGGEKAMTELLAKYPNMKGLVAYNEETATGAAAAARAQGKRDLVLIGANGGSVGYDSVRSGKINATVKSQNPDTGRCAVWGAYDAANGEKIPPTVKTTAPKLVNKDTVDQVPTWDDTLKQRYGKTQ